MSVAQLRPPTRSSLLPEARHVVVPGGITSTGFPAVERTCREFGDRFDQWQAQLNRLLLAKRSDGLYAADLAAMSIPRQVGKTWDVGRVVFALCIAFPGLSVVWTAHRTKVAFKTFQEQRTLAMSAKMAGHIDQREGKGVKTGAGDRSITFLNGSTIEFAAREKAARGFFKIDVLVIDEGQILTESALSDLVPTQNQATNPLVIVMGTPPQPPKPGQPDKGEVFRRLRREALSGQSTDTLWVEFGAEPGSDPDDEAAWREANPSYPRRTPARAIRRMRRLLALDDFLREALGIWDEDDDDDGPLIDLAAWAGLKDPAAPEPTTACLFVDVAPDRRWSSIAVASSYGEKTLVIVRRRAGTGWVVDELVKLYDKHELLEVALYPGSQAGALVADIESATRADDTPVGIEVERVTLQEMGAACAAFQSGIPVGRYVHVGQAELDAAVENVKTRMSGEVEVWDRRKWKTDISPAVAAASAAYRWTKLKESDYDLLDSVH